MIYIIQKNIYNKVNCNCKKWEQLNVMNALIQI